MIPYGKQYIDQSYFLTTCLKVKEFKDVLTKIIEKWIALQYYYIHINQQAYYVKKGCFKKFKNMEKFYLEAFSLPIYYKLSKKEQNFVMKYLEELL